MKKRNVNIEELILFLGNEVVNVYGDIRSGYIDNLADLEHVNETTSDWINSTTPNKQTIVEKSLAHVMLVDEEIKPVQGKIFIVVKHPKMALAKIGNHFFVDKPKSGKHPTAIIHPEAEIGSEVSIGAYCVIGKSTIGDGCIIDSHVRIYDDVIIGNNCKIKAGAVIGGVGLGFEKDEEGNRFRFPQIGGVEIGNHVEIGANSCVDRGALSNTVIEDCVKIDNLCHIAHNVRIGKNTVVVACSEISGSCVLGNNVWTGPNVSIRDQRKVGEGSLVGMGAVVVKDITEREVWAGNPPKKMR